MKNISENPICADLFRRVKEHVNVIYPDADADKLVSRLISAMKLDTHCQQPVPFTNLWNEKDVVLITYGDSLKRDGERPLVTLGDFLDTELKGIVSGVHILPFFPYSSDEGFSVIDYLAVNGSLGSWQDISDIASRYRLMSDLVINHCSSKSRWFENYQRGEQPGKGYFMEADPQDDLTQVVRPRTSPLLRKTETNDGARYVWCTFSHDQVDLNFQNTDVLLEFVRIIR
ncbi:MAG: alpha-amylase family glycosyl hydrolase, partial [Arenicellales bacterium]